MKKSFFTIAFLFGLTLVHAQNSKYDSLKKLLVSAKDDATKLLRLHGLCLGYFWSYPDSSLAYVKQEISLAQQIKSDVALANAYHNYGWLYIIMGDYPQALHFIQESLTFAEKSGNLLAVAYAYDLMVPVYVDQGDYKRAYTYETMAKSKLELYKKGPFNKISDSAAGRKPIEVYISVLQGLATVYEKLNKLDSALIYARELDEAYEKMNGKKWAAASFSLGNIYLKKRDYATALQHYRDGIALAIEDDNKKDLMDNCNGEAKTFRAMGLLDSSVIYANKVLEISKSARYLIAQRDALKLIADVYKARNNNDSLATYLQLTMAINDTLFSQRKLLQLQSMTFNEELHQQEEAQQRQQLQTKIKLYSLLAVSGVLLLLAIIILRNMVLKRRNEKMCLQHELEIQKLEGQKQLSELEMRALRAQMNPHFIFNSLNAINRFILQNNKVQASEYLTKFSRLIRLILQNSQETLIPLESELQALQLYLEMEALRFEDQFEYKIQVNDDIDVSMTKVPPLFIQPYAENAIWHGLMHKQEKGHLEIGLLREDQMLCCRITDNGIGRKKAVELKSKSAYSYKSLGMRLTADRIAMVQQKQLKGSIEVTDLMLPDGGPGGTEVLIKIPLHYD